MRAIHLSTAARRRHRLGSKELGPRGSLPVDDLAQTRRIAARINADRIAGRAPGPPNASAGDLAALGVLHEVFHHLVDLYATEVRPGALTDAAAALDRDLGRPGVDRVATAFSREFGASLDVSPGHDPEPPDAPDEARAEALEELLLLSLANANPAAEPLRELFDDRALREKTPYPRLVAGLESFLEKEPGFEPGGLPLVAMLRAPLLAAPTSLAGQLRWIRDNWAGYLAGLGDLLDRLILALDVIAEEERGLHLRFGGGGGSAAEAPSFAGLETEAERFSWDSDWMPRLVLIAKSTYVWLDQLSRHYSRDIRTLDAIPDEELDRLARSGITGLWLIGLWQRSVASERIKRMRGNPDAVASAYSLDDYRIADDLGGEGGLMDLRGRAWSRGIRLSADMVPNHMGIDSGWVIEHPEWFMSLPEPPFPSYTYDGPDLSPDERVGIFLEDHYWNDSDAAVVFKRLDRWSGEARYIYHGNDGTSFPWNDTAQLDYLKSEVREAVIQTILGVARRFPVIRFDAAMVLAKKHVQRLWYPEPGGGGGIPSRAEHGLPKAEFDRLMPNEFWREVVDRVAIEVPDTLLLAEAFWLLEGYFVRTLGMHRVYNSAFMHMLRDEDNAGYRRVMKETLEFDPEILKRYVNFMNNPDEKSALEQFGKGDKYFGIATLLATLPGLPMIGHGQIEGYGEKYGMEFRRATLAEEPDPWLMERHEREIFPLFHQRGRFAEVLNFVLYDFATGSGSIDDNVFAYSNGLGGERSLVVYHNRFGSTAGRIRDSVAFVEKSQDGSKTQVRRTLAEGLGLSNDGDALVAFTDQRTGLEYLRRVGELRDGGLYVELDAYRCHVFWGFREVSTASGPWARLADRLGGRGVPSLEDALRELELEPVHEPLRALFRDGPARRILDAIALGAAESDPGVSASLDEIGWRAREFLIAAADATASGLDGDAGAGHVRDGLAASLALPLRSPLLAAALSDDTARATLFSWIALSPIGDGVMARARFDALRLGGPLAGGLRELGLDEAAAWAVVKQVRVLLGLPRAATLGGPPRTRAARVAAALFADPVVRAAVGMNTWEGVDYIGREAWESVVEWAAVLDALDATRVRGLARAQPVKPALAFAERLRAAAAEAGYRVDVLLAAFDSSAVAKTVKETAAAGSSRSRKASSGTGSPSGGGRRRS
jgi:glycosidase